MIVSGDEAWKPRSRETSSNPDVAIAAAVSRVVRRFCRHNNGGKIKADTGDDASVKAMVIAVAAEFGRIDILVNCAAQPGGQAKPPVLAEISNEVFWADINVKVMGYLRTVREVVPHMQTQRGGRIVNISGLAARSTGNIVGSIRNVSVAALAKIWPTNLAHLELPLCVYTPASRVRKKLRGILERRAKAEGVKIDEVERKIADGNLVRKMITVEELGYLVAFLVSPRAVAINGNSIAAGGGAPGSIYY